MKQEQLKKFQALFEVQKKGLLYSNQFINENFSMNSDEMSDELDLSSVELEQSMRVRLRNREALLIKKIDQSLERIQAGTFGVCDSCEEDIDLTRLEVRPTATLCLSCKEHEEMQETRSADGRESKSMGSKINLRIA